jgi:hypothetical protein
LYLLDGLLHFRGLSINPFLRDDLPGEGMGLSDEGLKPIAEICGDLCGVQYNVALVARDSTCLAVVAALHRDGVMEPAARFADPDREWLESPAGY